MSDKRLLAMREAARITCCVHQRLAAKAAAALDAANIPDILVQSARCVRQQVHPRAWLLPGFATSLNDSPTEIFRITCRRENAESIMESLVTAVDLSASGRGSVYAQHIEDCGSHFQEVDAPPAGTRPPQNGNRGLLHDFSLITAILSGTGTENLFVREALELRAGVPVVSLGTGTGIRDRLGLLRITIPPEKEIVQLVVPSHDADGILRLLIETARMDRPGAGFLYRTPVHLGKIDPMVRIGQQAHAASIEQIIAAVDELKNGTAWRQRFRAADRLRHDEGTRIQRHYREVSFVCAEGGADALVRAAMQAGAGAATVSRVRCLRSESGTAVNGAREQGTMIVPAATATVITKALLATAPQDGENDLRIQILDAPAVFFHQRT